VSKNKITERGAAKVASFVEQSDSVESLILQRNRLKELGACALAEAIKRNSSLKILE